MNTVPLLTTREEILHYLEKAPSPVGLVMTMGALHAGHAALIQTARELCETVVCTVFVNPTQFGPHEDLDCYPRDIHSDERIAAAAGADVIYAPSVMEVYPNGEPQITVDPGPLARELEGAARPGHFAGVLTVVNKFLNLLRPDVAFFGEKDYQQLTVIRQMVRDLDLPVEIASVPILRDEDGLALSSRNVYLSPQERERAKTLHRALKAGAAEGIDGVQRVYESATAVLDTAGIRPEYLELRSVDLARTPSSGTARLLVAARIGSTRLIDSMPVELSPQ